MGIGYQQIQYDIAGIVKCIEQRKCVVCQNSLFGTCSINGGKIEYDHTCDAFKPSPYQVKIVRDRIESVAV